MNAFDLTKESIDSFGEGVFSQESEHEALKIWLLKRWLG